MASNSSSKTKQSTAGWGTIENDEGNQAVATPEQINSTNAPEQDWDKAKEEVRALRSASRKRIAAEVQGTSTVDEGRNTPTSNESSAKRTNRRSKSFAKTHGSTKSTIVDSNAETTELEVENEVNKLQALLQTNYKLEERQTQLIKELEQSKSENRELNDKLDVALKSKKEVIDACVSLNSHLNKELGNELMCMNEQLNNENQMLKNRLIDMEKEIEHRNNEVHKHLEDSNGKLLALKNEDMELKQQLATEMAKNNALKAHCRKFMEDIIDEEEEQAEPSAKRTHLDDHDYS